MFKNRIIPDQSQESISEKELGNAIAHDIVNKLRTIGMRDQDVADFMGIDRSHVTRVRDSKARIKKSIKLGRLGTFEKQTEIPWPLLYLTASKSLPMSDKLRKNYEIINRIIQENEQIKSMLKELEEMTK